MFKKCKANCLASKYLWIRNNNIFYFIMELDKSNNKRKYFTRSLHTNNYYEAIHRANNMIMTLNTNNIEVKQLIYEAKSLMNSLIFEEYDEEIDSGDQILLRKVKRLSSLNDIQTVKRFLIIYTKLNNINMLNLDKDDIEVIAEIIKIVNNNKQLDSNKILNKYKTSTSIEYTIEDIMESMLKKADNVKSVENKRRKLITNIINEVNLKLTDKYSDFYNKDIIENICQNIDSKSVKGNVKRSYAKEIKALIEHANILNPDIYKTNLIHLILNFKKTSKEEMNPHWPYTSDELKQIFNPSNDYFKSNKDVFWTTLIGLFVGARCNAAITLQYGDIINIDNIDCIKFQNNHSIKQLKNQATIRTVPIPQQLLNLGLVDWIKKQKTKLNAKDTDFIFSRCQTKSGKYNNKFTTRGLIKYIKDIGITAKNNHKLNFHSLRKNANNCLESNGVSESFINQIIGWEGKDTREKSYSNHNLSEIKENADKLIYDFLQEEFDKWKEIMSTNS